jgi:DNA polymerase/3'-5' exonuclease PolX
MPKKVSNKKENKDPLKPKTQLFKANQDIIDGLEKLKLNYQLEKNRGKVMGYQKAITTLKALKKPITSPEIVLGLPGIGTGIMKKVKEYFDNGKFRDIKDPFNEKKMTGLKELNNIWGVGPTHALDLYGRGYTSIEKLRAHENKKGATSVLTSLQKIGLDYYEDLLEKIPWNEVN